MTSTTAATTGSRALKVAYQGVPGAYSEMAALQMFAGIRVQCVPYDSFEAVFEAVERDSQADFALLPFENTLGGSIHQNYDLCLRFNLHVIAEIQFRVRHCLLALPGVQRSDIKRVTSHPQALAQCESYIRLNHWESVAAYDTAGSAMKIKQEGLKDTASIASQRVAEMYNLQILDEGIEDNSNNYTRFLLLSRDKATPTTVAPKLSTPTSDTATTTTATTTTPIVLKTSIVFSVLDRPGVLFQALACFAMRDIDLVKIESRPNAKILESLAAASSSSSSASNASVMKSPVLGNRIAHVAFYLDFLASLTEERTTNALRQLSEFAPYIRVLGCYPASKPGMASPPPPICLPYTLLQSDGHSSSSSTTSSFCPPEASLRLCSSVPSTEGLRIAIVGFGTFGQFLAKEFRRRHQVVACSRTDYRSVASALGVEFFRSEAEMLLARSPDVVVFSVSILSFSGVLEAFPKNMLENTLVVDVLSVKSHPKALLLQCLPPAADILCTHPMFGPESAKARGGWNNFPLVYEKVRISDSHRCARFLEIFEQAGCRMVPMTCEDHDRYAAGSQFITHLTGRMLSKLGITSTPINTMGFETLIKLMENTCKDSWDLFTALYRHNPNAQQQIDRMMAALTDVKASLEQEATESNSSNNKK